MRGPVHPRLLARASATRGFLAATVAVGLVTSVLLIVQAWLIATLVTHVFRTHELPETWQRDLWLLLGVFAARALLSWLSAVLAHRSAAAVKSQLRRDVLAARLRQPVGGASSATVVGIVTTGLDALDGYYSKYLPQLGLAATVPFIVGAAVLWTDWRSAIIIAFTLPLIPVFMALIGWTTEKATAHSFRVADRLANHFADLIEGLPTLQAFARARAQAHGVQLSEEQYRGATMRVLRVSFLSSLALELLASLSVAIVAVTVGFRLVYGHIDFTPALFVLILAPEAFLPVRQVGVHFHDSADGVAAADAAFAVIDAAPAAHASPPTAQVSAPSAQVSSKLMEHGAAGGAEGQLPPYVPSISGEPRPSGATGDAGLRLEGVSYTYPGTDAPAVDNLSLEVRPGEVVALSGASGGGKSTALALVMGFLTPSQGRVLVHGTDLNAIEPGTWHAQVAWVAQVPGLVRGTVGDNVTLGLTAPAANVERALADAGADFGPGKPVGDDGEGLSAGERRRVAVARALLRIRVGGAWLLVLDEPTAGLDADAEAAVIDAVRESGAAALVVSHRPAVLAAADRVVQVVPV